MQTIRAMTKTSTRAVIAPPQAELCSPARATGEQLLQFLKTIEQPEHQQNSLSGFLDEIFQIREVGGEERAVAERFIHDCFSRVYGADITRFMPRLFELLTRRGELTAAFGVRDAAETPLFLEAYLDAPIDLVLEAQLGYRPARDKIVEVGNLAAVYPGAVRWLIMALTARLHQEGYKWVVFTATNELKNGFGRLGFRPISLAPARVERLKEEDRTGWGRYYDAQPTVMVGNIDYGYHEIEIRREFNKIGD
ncbi:MAG: thermostable hemolysin [Pseudomonadota bacterium]